MKPASVIPAYHLSHRAPLYFMCLSVLAQIIALGVFLLLQNFISNPVILIGALSVTAFGIARWLKLSLPWQFFNLLLVPGIVVFTVFSLPQWLALILLAAFVLLYLPTFWTRVPYYPTSRKMYDHVLKLLPAQNQFSFLDLGCGFGGLLAYLAKARPEGSFTGFELSPLAFLICKLHITLRRLGNVEIRLGNFWTKPLGSYDVVYAFLSPTPMPYLWDKIKQEGKKGGIFITNTFRVEASPSQTITLDETPQNALYIHRL